MLSTRLQTHESVGTNALKGCGDLAQTVEPAHVLGQKDALLLGALLSQKRIHKHRTTLDRNYRQAVQKARPTPGRSWCRCLCRSGRHPVRSYRRLRCPSMPRAIGEKDLRSIWTLGDDWRIRSRKRGDHGEQQVVGDAFHEEVGP